MAMKWLRLLTILTMALFAAVWASTQQPLIPEPLAKIKAKYVGSKICFDCHIDVAKVWAQVPHSQWMLDEKLPEHLRGCEACHGPGSLHVVQRPGNIVAWSKLSIAEQNAICLQCHKVVTAEKWLASPHGSGKQYAPSCVTCHEVHKPVDRRWMLKARAYDLCVKCHSEIVARSKVGQHHSVSGQAARCAACHDAHDSSIPGMLKAPLMELCKRCHKLEDVKPADHTPEFVKEHGKKFKPTNRRCISCHGRNGCQECHGIEMPHPQGFAVKHGEPASSRPQVCSRCHQRSYCSKCHESAPPSSHEAEDYATKGHGEEYQKRTANYCALCHERSFCAQCHRGKPELLQTLPE
jgi:predicted CXXCH cytochrome family protein